ncbi:hypothetical protein ACVWZK_006799 [Bradyrhizobium sp. GM0.4]
MLERRDQNGRIGIGVHRYAAGRSQQVLDRKPSIRQLGHPEQIERADEAPDFCAGTLVLEQLGKYLRAAYGREVVGNAEVGEFDGPYRAAPDPQQGQHHRKGARRAVADHDNQRSCAHMRREPGVEGVEPKRMLERGGGRVVEQLRVVRRQEVESLLDGDVECVARSVHTQPRKQMARDD